MIGVSVTRVMKLRLRRLRALVVGALVLSGVSASAQTDTNELRQTIIQLLQDREYPDAYRTGYPYPPIESERLQQGLLSRLMRIRPGGLYPPREFSDLSLSG